MTQAPRVSPEEIYGKVKSGDALLICSYNDEEKCKKLHLEGAIFLSALKTKVPSLAAEQEIVFYCA